MEEKEKALSLHKRGGNRKAKKGEGFGGKKIIPEVIDLPITLT